MASIDKLGSFELVGYGLRLTKNVPASSEKCCLREDWIEEEKLSMSK